MDFSEPYVYNGRLVDVDPIVDGDTIDLRLDLGFKMFTESRFRLRRVDTHETYGVKQGSEEYEKGVREKEWVVSWFRDAYIKDVEYPLRIKTFGTGKYGRWMAEVQRKSDKRVLNDDILEQFDNVEY